MVLSWHHDLRLKRALCWDVATSTQKAPIILYGCHGGKGNQHFLYNLVRYANIAFTNYFTFIFTSTLFLLYSYSHTFYSIIGQLLQNHPHSKHLHFIFISRYKWEKLNWCYPLWLWCGQHSPLTQLELLPRFFQQFQLLHVHIIFSDSPL